MAIENMAWVLPRPAKSKYKGAVPLHFEKKLFGLYDNPHHILQPFGGMGQFGLIADIKLEVKPNIVSDAHALPFPANTFDFVFVDPPYSNEESVKMYGTGKLRPLTYIREASRVCKPFGFIALYHKLMLPRPPQTIYHRRIFVGTRIWHTARICTIFQKYPCSHGNICEDCKICWESFG